jgi:hypothetical protein
VENIRNFLTEDFTWITEWKRKNLNKN